MFINNNSIIPQNQQNSSREQELNPKQLDFSHLAPAQVNLMKKIREAAFLDNKVTTIDFINKLDVNQLKSALVNDGNSPLHLVCSIVNDLNYSRMSDIAQALICRGIDINQINCHRSTPLHTLFRREKIPLQFIKQLLSKNPDMNAKNCNGDTPFHVLCSNESLASTTIHEIAKLIIKKCNDINTTNKQRKTPLDLAFKAKQLKVVELLMTNNGFVTADTQKNINQLNDFKYYNQNTTRSEIKILTNLKTYCTSHILALSSNATPIVPTIPLLIPNPKPVPSISAREQVDESEQMSTEVRPLFPVLLKMSEHLIPDAENEAMELDQDLNGLFKTLPAPPTPLLYSSEDE
jgi:ankyrin repeat protein